MLRLLVLLRTVIAALDNFLINIMLQEEPRLIGEYLNNRKALIRVEDMPREDIAKWVNYLRTRSGRRIVRFETPMRTEVPSLQGNPTDYGIVRSNNNGFYSKLLSIAVCVVFKHRVDFCIVNFVKVCGSHFCTNRLVSI